MLRSSNLTYFSVFLYISPNFDQEIEEYKVIPLLPRSSYPICTIAYSKWIMEGAAKISGPLTEDCTSNTNLICDSYIPRYSSLT